VFIFVLPEFVAERKRVERCSQALHALHMGSDGALVLFRFSWGLISPCALDDPRLSRIAFEWATAFDWKLGLSGHLREDESAARNG
jgi:hypothetical protein